MPRHKIHPPRHPAGCAIFSAPQKPVAGVIVEKIGRIHGK
jgi:hypothetical protein